MNKEILRITLPSIVTNITVPLLGIVDLAIVGHISEESAAAIIGAVSVGTLIFNMVYWLFNFLRMGSSGLTAQAYGRGDTASQRRILRMALTVALGCGSALVALQRPIEWTAQWIIAPSEEVWTLAIAYFRIRIWAAPAVLALFAMNGWLVGMQNSRYPMYIAIGQNLINITVSYLLVTHFHLGIEGVAMGTVLSQYIGLAAACLFCIHLQRQSGHLSTKLSTPLSTNQQETVQIEWKTFFVVNRDIFFRMICLIAVTTAFTSYGARMGDTMLAVNTLLMQLFTLFSYFSDSFALAGEALVGKRIGGKQSPAPLIHWLFLWGWGVALLFTLTYGTGGMNLLKIFTQDQELLQATSPYLTWVTGIPLCGIAAFMWDGIYIGATRTRQMFISLLIGALLFFGIYEAGSRLIDPKLLNHLLWGAFLTYLLARGGVLWWYWEMDGRRKM